MFKGSEAQDRLSRVSWLRSPKDISKQKSRRRDRRCGRYFVIDTPLKMAGGVAHLIKHLSTGCKVAGLNPEPSLGNV
jgi:hypothetical protein